MRIRSGRPAQRGKRRKIDVLESAIDWVEALRLLVGKDVDHRTAGEEARRDDLVTVLVFLQLRSIDPLRPDLAAGRGHQVRGPALELDASAGEHGHSWAEVGDVVDDVRRQDHDDVVANSGKQVE